MEILIWMPVHGSQGDHRVVPHQDIRLLVVVIVVLQRGLEQGTMEPVARTGLGQNGKVDWILSYVDEHR